MVCSCQRLKLFVLKERLVDGALADADPSERATGAH